MKLGGEAPELDAIDLQILSILQEHGRIAHVKLGEQVGLSAPSVIERVKKLEDSGIIVGYHAAVDAQAAGEGRDRFYRRLHRPSQNYQPVRGDHRAD